MSIDENPHELDPAFCWSMVSRDRPAASAAKLIPSSKVRQLHPWEGKDVTKESCDILPAIRSAPIDPYPPKLSKWLKRKNQWTLWKMFWVCKSWRVRFDTLCADCVVYHALFLGSHIGHGSNHEWIICKTLQSSGATLLCHEAHEQILESFRSM